MKKGWEIKRLPAIAEYFIGLTYSPKDVGSEGTIVLRSSNVQNDELDLSDLVRVTCSVKKPLHVRKGDILMCSRNGSKRLVGKTAVIGDLPEEMTFGTFMTVIRSELNPYLSWFFRSEAFRDQIGVGENTMINQITKYMLDVISVPVPPLAEQQRIVGLLDEAFAGLATAKANAEKNLQNARALFESHLQSVFTQRGEGWVEKTLGDLGAIRTGKRDANHQVENGPYPFYTCAFGQFKSPTFSFDGPSIILPGNGANVGKVFFYDGKFEAYQRTYVVNELNQAINSRFLYFCFIANWPRWIANKQFGSATNYIVVGDLKAFLVPTPSLPVQLATVEQLESFTEEAQRLAAIYERKLAALQALKKSLLDQAFSGNL